MTTTTTPDAAPILPPPPYFDLVAALLRHAIAASFRYLDANHAACRPLAKVLRDALGDRAKADGAELLGAILAAELMGPITRLIAETASVPEVDRPALFDVAAALGESTAARLWAKGGGRRLHPRAC